MEPIVRTSCGAYHWRIYIFLEEGITILSVLFRACVLPFPLFDDCMKHNQLIGAFPLTTLEKESEIAITVRAGKANQG